MSSDELRRRLMPMDAFFLYAERPEQPMHVGATCIFDGKITHPYLVRHIESRLHLIPRYQQRVVPAPFNIGHPTWENDPDFDMKNHIFRVSLKGTKDDVELRALSGKIFTGMLDRNKPLWEIYLVEGLKDGRTAMVFKVHHCMVDGVAGIGLAAIAFDMTPEPVKLKKQPFKAAPIPDSSTLLYDALWDNAIDGIEHWSRFQRSLINFGKGFESSDVARAIKKFATTISGFLLPFSKTPFNGPLGPDRHVAWLEVPFADARAIRAVSGGTVNDVVLSALGCAVKIYMKKRGEEKKTPRALRVLVPVNVRQEHERAALGNRISFMPVEVPLHFDDPIEILHAVHINTKEMKDSKIPDSVSLMFEALQGMPAPMQAMALNGASNPVIQNLLSYFTAMPPGNMICTNVPGPNIPLYVMGKRLIAMYPKVPVVMEMGINLALTSYDQKLFLCFCADGRAGRDVELFKKCFAEAFAKMLEMAEVKSADYVRISRTRHAEHHAPEPAPTPPHTEAIEAAPTAEKAPAPRKKKAVAVAKKPSAKKAPAKRTPAKKAVAKKAPAKKSVPAKLAAKSHVEKSHVANSAPKPHHVAEPAAAHNGNGHAAPASGTPRIHLGAVSKK
jgi:diacylglycerol O-acyltransferase